MGQTASVEAIDALLPQTQCTRCGYNGCLPYAEALASGEAAINRCPPGGSDTIQRLATLLGTPVLPLDEALESPRLASRQLVVRARDGSLQALFPAWVDGSPPAPRASVIPDTSA